MWIDGRTTTVFWLFVVLGGVVDGSGSKCRVANLFSSVLVFSLGGILGWPIGNGREESIDDNDLSIAVFEMLIITRAILQLVL